MLFITALPVSYSQNCRCYKHPNLTANVLDCSSSGMTSLTDLLVPNETNWLVAKDNKIIHLEWFEESSRSPHQIGHVNLANCSINSIRPNFFLKLANLSKVHYLNLAGNKLKAFNQDIRKSNWSQVYLSGNPIDCTCDMLWFAEWLNTANSPLGPRIVQDYQNIRCVGGEWNGTQVYKLSKEQMGCFPTVREL